MSISTIQREPSILLAYIDFTTPEENDMVGYHLGIGYLRAYLEQAGIPTDQLIVSEPISLDELVQEILRVSTHIIGFTCFDDNYYLLRELSSRLKKLAPDRTIIVGGPSATFSDRFILENCDSIDICVRGEGEETVAELFPSIMSGSDISGIRGLSFRSGTEVVRTPPRQYQVNGEAGELDRYPSPYLTGVIPPSKGLQTGVLSSRGCRYHCTYCNFAAMSHHTLRLHSVERVVAELSAINEACEPTRLLHIHDDAFTHFPERLKRICRSIISNDLNRIGYTCNGRIDHLDEEALCLLRDANIRPHFGIESASPKVLSNICKIGPEIDGDTEYKREQNFLKRIEEKVALAYVLGISDLSTSIILGLPGEGLEEGRRSVEFIRRLGVREYAHNFLRVYAGTKLFEDHARFGIRIEASPYGLPYQTHYAYDVSKVEPLPNASQLRISNREQGILSDVFTGKIESGEGRHPWAVLLQDPMRTPEYCRQFLHNAPSLSTYVCLLSNLWSNTMKSEWHQWVAANRLVIPKPRYFSGSTDQQGVPEGRMVVSPSLLSGTASHWLFDSLTSFFGGHGYQPEHCAGVFLTFREEKDLNLLEQFLCERHFSLPMEALAYAPLRIVDACRWGSKPCPAVSLPRLICRGKNVYPCFAGSCLGSVDDGLPFWSEGISSIIREVERARGCRDCEANAWCSRCPFPGKLNSESFCRVKRQYRHCVYFFDLMEDLWIILKEKNALESITPRAKEVTILRGMEPDCFFISWGEDEMIRYQVSDKQVSAIGETVKQVLKLIGKDLTGRALQKSLANQIGITEEQAVLILRHLETEYDLPARMYEEDFYGDAC